MQYKYISNISNISNKLDWGLYINFNIINYFTLKHILFYFVYVF